MLPKLKVVEIVASHTKDCWFTASPQDDINMLLPLKVVKTGRDRKLGESHSSSGILDASENDFTIRGRKHVRKNNVDFALTATIALWQAEWKPCSRQ